MVRRSWQPAADVSTTVELEATLDFGNII